MLSRSGRTFWYLGDHQRYLYRPVVLSTRPGAVPARTATRAQRHHRRPYLSLVVAKASPTSGTP